MVPRPVYIFAAIAAFSITASTALAQSISMVCTKSAGVPMKVIDVNLNNPDVKITAQMPKFGAGHSEPFGQMIHRTQPSVALTGTFFCTHSLQPIGDIVIDGQLTHFGGLGTAFCVTDNNEVEFVKPRKYTHHDWSKYDFVLCSGPRLITGGTAYVEPWSEGFRDKHMLNRNGRLAIGLTKYNHLLIVMTRRPVYLSRLAKAMRELGAVNAINLDAGSSMGLYYKGKTIITPSRRLTNLILVYNSRDQYYSVKDKLLPIRMRSASRSVQKTESPTITPAPSVTSPASQPVESIDAGVARDR